MDQRENGNCIVVDDETEVKTQLFMAEVEFENIWDTTKRPNGADFSDTASSVSEFEKIEHKIRPIFNPLFHRKRIADSTSNEIYEVKQASEENSIKSDKSENIIESEQTEDSTAICEELSPECQKLYEEFVNEIECGEEVDKYSPCDECKRFSSKLCSKLSTEALELTYVIFTILCNKWTWNVCKVIGKVSAAVFVYLVLACSTILITIIINFYDAIESSQYGENEGSKPNPILATENYKHSESPPQVIAAS